MKRAAIFIILICLFFGCCVPFSKSANAAETNRYGYTQLKNNNQRAAYKALVSGLEAVDYKIKFTLNGITSANVNSVLKDVVAGCEMVTRDYPEFFWFDGAVSLSATSSAVTIEPRNGYTVEGKKINNVNDLKPYKAKLEQAVSKALAKIKSNYSEFEIAHTLHDYIVQNVSYVLDGDHQSAYGSLVNGKAVCAGYARGYQLLLNRAGVPSFYVAGDSYGPDGKLIKHAWNLVWLNGKCYYSDTTWDDQSNDLFHEYLNLSIEEISKTHFTNDPLPTNCGHDDYSFFVKNDTKNGVCDFHGHKTIEEVAGCFALKSMDGDIATYYCTIHYHGDNFNLWFEHVKKDLISALGLTGTVQCHIIELGLEHHITLSGKSSGTDVPETQPPGESTQPPVEVTPPATQGEYIPETLPTVQQNSQPATTDITHSSEAATLSTNTGTEIPNDSVFVESDVEGFVLTDDMVKKIAYVLLVIGVVAGGYLLIRALTKK